jgi:hypothetical protein
VQQLFVSKSVGQHFVLSQHSVFVFLVTFWSFIPAYTASEVTKATKTMITIFFIVVKILGFRQYHPYVYDVEI